MGDQSEDHFVQSRLQWHVGCELVDDGVVYEQRTLLTRRATRVPFESIPDDPIRETRISRFFAVAVCIGFAAVLFAIQPLISGAAEASMLPIAVSLVALCLAGVGLRARSGQFVVFPCEGKRIVFIDDGGEPPLPAFLDQLQVKKTKYLSETYGPRPTESDGERREFSGFDENEDDPGGFRH